MITLNASGGSITFTFDGNSTYLNDGTITCPVNSLALIIDESDMISFKKANSNDLFVSANIAEFGMTKDELIAWYKANAVGSTGGGGGVTPSEVQTMIDESVSGKADSSAVTAEISAAVSGKADTSYVDSAVSGKVDTTTYSAYTAATDSRLAEDEEVTAAALVNLNEALSGKVDTTTFNTYSGSVETALSGKQDTLVSGTNIKTINNTSILGSGNIDIQGGGVNVVQTTGTSTSDVMSQDAVTTAINSKMDEVNLASFYGNQYSAGLIGYYYDSQTETQTQKFNWGMVWQSDGSVGFDSAGNLTVFNKLDTSAITTSITSASTDAQVPSAKAVYDALGGGGSSYSAGTGIDITNDVISVTGMVETSAVTSAVTSGSTDVLTSGGAYEQFGGLKLVKLTESEYAALVTKDPNVLYVVIPDPSNP